MYTVIVKEIAASYVVSLTFMSFYNAFNFSLSSISHVKNLPSWKTGLQFEMGRTTLVDDVTK